MRAGPIQAASGASQRPIEKPTSRVPASSRARDRPGLVARISVLVFMLSPPSWLKPVPDRRLGLSLPYTRVARCLHVSERGVPDICQMGCPACIDIESPRWVDDGCAGAAKDCVNVRDEELF